MFQGLLSRHYCNLVELLDLGVDLNLVVLLDQLDVGDLAGPVSGQWLSVGAVVVRRCPLLG